MDAAVNNNKVKNPEVTRSKHGFKDEIKKEWKWMLGIFAVSLIAVLISSTTTNNFSQIMIDGDSAANQIVGKNWLSGMVPYKDMWSSEGPITLFINMLGYLITGSPVGVMIFQVVFLCASLFIAYSFLRSSYEQLHAFLFTVIVGVLYIAVTEGGNCAEEYALPFLMASFCNLFVWFRERERGLLRHNPRTSLCYGLTIGICLFTRVTMVLPLLVMYVMMIGYLIFMQKVKNTIFNILYTLLGIALVFVPFLVYFAASNSLNYLRESLIMYNKKYILGASPVISSIGLIQFIHGLVWILPSLFILVSGIYACILIKKRKYTGIAYIATAVVTAATFIMSYGYRHYAIATIPYFVIIVRELKRILDSKRTDIDSYDTAYQTMIVVIVLSILSVIPSAVSLVRQYSGSDAAISVRKEQMEVINNLLSEVPEDKKDKVITYNCYPGYYIKEKVTPVYRFFYNQDINVANASVDNTILSETRSEYRELEAEYILLETIYRTAVIETTLNADYEKIEEVDVPNKKRVYRLYKKLDSSMKEEEE